MQACIRSEYWGHPDNGNCYVMSVNGQWSARLSLKREPMAMILMVRRCARTIYLCDDGKDKKKKKLEYKVSSDHRNGLGRSSLFSLGYQQQGAAAWFRVRTRRQPQVDGCLQRAVSREGCHDLHRIGMYILRRLFSHEANRC